MNTRLIRDVSSNLLRKMLIPMTLRAIKYNGKTHIFITGGHAEKYTSFTCNLIMLIEHSEQSFIEHDISNKGYQVINDVLPIEMNGQLDVYIVGTNGMSMMEVGDSLGNWIDMTVRDAKNDMDVLHRIVQKGDILTAVGKNCMYISDPIKHDKIHLHRQSLEGMDITDICTPYLYKFEAKNGVIDEQIKDLGAKRGDVLCIECTDSGIIKIE